MDEAKQKHLLRAQKFGVPYQQPKTDKNVFEQRRSARAKRFGLTPPPLITEFKDRQLDWPNDTEQRHDTLLIYGTDGMDSKDVMNYFGDRQVTLEWVNLSSCNVVFGDAETAKTAFESVIIHSHSEPNQPIEPPLTASPQPIDTAAHDSDVVMHEITPSEPSTTTATTQSFWKLCKPFSKGDKSWQISARIATVLDVRPPDSTPWAPEGLQFPKRARGRGSGTAMSDVDDTSNRKRRKRTRQNRQRQRQSQPENQTTEFEESVSPNNNETAISAEEIVDYVEDALETFETVETRLDAEALDSTLVDE
eukprot:c4492_g1_i1.p1 GENE.c4492_g1_i1~~c4492_g1_i1.p1  ORF type:complete len:321 (+),score=73.81 c4492_g1_i1:45-965(+)